MTTKEERAELRRLWMRLPFSDEMSEVGLRLLDERDKLARFQRVVCTMLSWINIPPLESIEADLNARAARLRAAEASAEKAEAEVARLKGELADSRAYTAEVALGVAHASTVCDPETPCVRCQRDAAKEQVERLTKGLLAVDELIRESRGVDGLHRNGDIATWEELLEGGRFDDWLKDFSAALAAIAPSKPEGTMAECPDCGTEHVPPRCSEPPEASPPERITSEEVRALHDRTGKGLMECKAALVEARKSVPERIVAAAVRSMTTGPNHAECLNGTRRLGRHDEQGFLTSAGRFVDRVEALKIATAAGQLVGRNYPPLDRLMSEDLEMGGGE